MQTYDVVITGSDFTAYVAAFYLAKKDRRIALIQTPNPSTYEYLKKPLIDADKIRYPFDYPYRELGGLEPNQLTQSYLEAMGLSALTLNVIKQKETEIIQAKDKRYQRPNDWVGFRIYLVRFYPKYRDQIHRFFADMNDYYEDFKHQRFERFKDRPYRLSKMMASFRNKSLETVLKEYFEDDILREEFRFFQAVDGYKLHEIHATEYFKRFFNSMIEQSYYLVQTDASLYKMFDMQQFEDVDVYKSTIESIDNNEQGIQSITLSSGQKIAAEYFILDQPYGALKQQGIPLNNRFKQSLYIALEAPAETYGFHALNVLLSVPKSALSIRVINYGYFHPKQKPSLRIETVNPMSEDAVINEIITYFPALKGHIKKVKASDVEPLYSSLIQTAKMSLEHTDKADRLQHRYSFGNTLYSGSKIGQESGLIGRLMLGVELADLIEKRLKQKESDTVIAKQNMLISKLLHGYKKMVITDDVMVSFDFGKRKVPVRFNHQNAYTYDKPVKIQLNIKASYMILEQLRQGQITIADALTQKQLSFTGDVNLFKAITASLRLGERAVTPPKYVSYPKPYGYYMLIINMALLTVWMGAVMQTQTWIVTAIYVGILIIKVFIQTLRLKLIMPSDFIGFGVALIVFLTNYFDITFHVSNVPWIYAGVLLLGLVLKKPWLYYEMYRDEKPADAFTFLYVTMMQGLTWLWTISFVLVGIILRYVEMPNTWLYIYVFVIMMYISGRYKKNYILNTIKGRM